MANHISHAALPYPVKNARYTLLVPFLDADGDPTDPTLPDTEVSLDNGAFADAVEEVTLAPGARGMGMFTLTATDMNNSAVGVWFGASTAKATLATLYPRILPVLESGTAQAGAAGSITLASGAAAYDIAGCIVRTTGGTGGGGANNQARVVTAYNTSTKVATVVPNWETTPDATTTYDVLYTDLAVHAVAGRFLRPTTDGRTLDVSAGGEAGMDWANVGTPGSTVSLSATTVATATSVTNRVTANTDQWNGVAPNALVSGRVDSSTGAMAAGVVTAAAIATGAVDADALAADAVAEIADGVWDEDIVAAHGTADTAGRALRTLDAVSDRTNNANLNALLGVADAVGADVPSQVTDEVWDEASADHVVAASLGERVERLDIITAGGTGGLTNARAVNLDNLDAAVTSRLAPTVASRTLDVTATGAAGVDWANVEGPATVVGLSGTTIKAVTDGVTVTTNNDKTGYALSAAGVQAIWDALTSALTVVGSIGKKLADWALGTDNRVLASANTHTSGVTVAAVTGAVGSVTGDVTGSVGSLATQAKADVNAEVVDVIRTDTLAELSAAPSATPTLSTAVLFQYMALRNQGTATATAETVANDGGTVIATATLADVAGVFTKGKFA